jgi:membrane-associated phospholipid phosphatase
MSAPRDYSAAQTVGAIRLARIFSNIVSPPVIFAVLGLALAWRELTLWPGFLWAAVFGFFVSLAPILFVVYSLRTGRITDLHMNTRRERRLPYIVSVAGAAVALALLRLFDGPELLVCLALLTMLELTVLGIINDFWLISIHTTSVSAAALLSWQVFGPRGGLLVLPLVVLVSAARLFLKRHTPAQVAAGLLLGAFSVWVLDSTGCIPG